MLGPSLGSRSLALVLAGGLAGWGTPTGQVHAQVHKVGIEAPGDPVAGLRTAVLPLEVTGDLSESDRDTLSSELIEGLRRGAFEVVDPSSVVSASSDAVDCREQDCYRKVAKATGATHVVRARVTVRDRDYGVEVELIDGNSGDTLASTREGCEICGIADAGNLMTTAAATLRTKLDALARGPSTLGLVSTPVGAEVRIDGEIVGVTPLERQVVPGKHVLRVTKEGYVALEREVTFIEGVQESLSFELEKVPNRLPSRPWGWVSLGLGIGGIATAGAFAALRDRPYKKIDGSCRGATDREGNCERLWNTEYHVLGFALAGAALTTLGVAILLSTSKRGKRSRTGKNARLGVGPGSAVVLGRF